MNRSEIVVFRSLTLAGRAISNPDTELEGDLANRNAVSRAETERRDDWCRGYDPALGARPMRRLIQREIEDPLSMLILSGDGSCGDNVIVDSNGRKLTVKFRKPRKPALAAPAEKPLIEAAR